MTDMKPFGQLSDAEKGKLLLAHHEGKRIECRHYEYPCTWNWRPTADPTWCGEISYRIAPEPLTPDTINWDHVVPEFKWMARDRHDFTYLYTAEPGMRASGWNDMGDMPSVEAPAFASYRRGTVDWRDSLVIRPGYEGHKP